MILVTGGAGYIGSHCVTELLKRNEKVVVFDNLSTGFSDTITRLKNIAANGQLKFVQGDLRNFEDVKKLFDNYEIDSVVHFAAFSQVEESMREPYKYFQNNVSGTINLLDGMASKGVKYIIYSSSAAVYGEPEIVPIKEDTDKKPINPYGLTKCITEMILSDYDKNRGIKSICLRYFNVAGANPEGITGECHNPETHLIPKILKSIKDSSTKFCIYGDDYPTEDGTCIRDYIDVNDLISAHLFALDYVKEVNKSDIFNVGTQKGSSVKEIFLTCQKVTGKNIDYKICPRRPGDPPILCADTAKIKRKLKWKPRFCLNDSIQNAWNWECR